MASFLRKEKPASNPLVLVPDYSNTIELTSLYVASNATNGALTRYYVAPSHGHFHWFRSISVETYKITFYILIGESQVAKPVAFVNVGNDGGHASTVILPMAKGDRLRIDTNHARDAFASDKVKMIFVPDKLAEF